MKKKRVLIVDDEKAFTTLLDLLLRGDGRYETRVENDSRKVHDAAKEFRPDIVLLDVIMPGLSGQDVLAILRGDEELKDLPIIFVTALASNPQAGVNSPVSPGRRESVLGKPVEGAELIRCIDRQLLAHASG